MDEHVTALETQIEEAQNRLENHDQALTAQGVEIEKVSGTAMDALERAKAAGKLAEGKLLYEVVLNSDKVFSYQSANYANASGTYLVPSTILLGRVVGLGAQVRW